MQCSFLAKRVLYLCVCIEWWNEIWNLTSCQCTCCSCMEKRLLCWVYKFLNLPLKEVMHVIAKWNRKFQDNWVWVLETASQILKRPFTCWNKALCLICELYLRFGHFKQPHIDIAKVRVHNLLSSRLYWFYVDDIIFSVWIMICHKCISWFVFFLEVVT